MCRYCRLRREIHHRRPQLEQVTQLSTRMRVQADSQDWLCHMNPRNGVRESAAVIVHPQK